MNDSGPQLLLEKKYFIVTIFGIYEVGRPNSIPEAVYALFKVVF